MSNVLIVDQISQSASSCPSSILGFRSILPISSFTGENENPKFPLVNALDYRDNTKYSPAITSGSVVIEFVQTSVQTIDYFAFAIHNSQDSGLSGMLEVFKEWSIIY